MPSVIGDIRAKWLALGGATSFLGQPLTDETTTPDRVGRFNHFQGGSIYWKPGLGAHEVHGSIRDKWAAMGWERSSLGYPTSDEQAGPGGGRTSHFEHGDISWTPSGGAVLAGAAAAGIVHQHADIATPDWLPGSAWIDLTVSQRGHFTFTGHVHNNGAPNTHFVLAAVLMTPSGVGYGFAHDHTTHSPAISDGWVDVGDNAQLAGNWGQVAQSTLHWRLAAYDTLKAGTQGLVEDVVKEAAARLGKPGVPALVAVI